VTPAKRVSDALIKARNEILAALAEAQHGERPTTRPVKFGAFIRQNREALGYTLQELAEKSGCTKSHLWAIESGATSNPTVSMVNGLARGLGIPVMSVFSAALNP
jgi:DNA-binding XRE family transcriptional regulator